MAKCPVCDMEVNEQNPSGDKVEHQGQTYYFCGPGCKRAFERNPARYLGGQSGGSHAGHHHM